MLDGEWEDAPARDDVWDGGDESLVDMRCSVVVLREESVLLVHRTWDDARPASGDWVLPGGRPRPHESMTSCARREVAEETGLDVTVGACLFVLEVSSAPPLVHRGVELVFAGAVRDAREPTSPESFRHAQFVPLSELGGLLLRPPIAGYLRGLLRRSRHEGAPYLGNLWRPDTTPAS